MLHSNRKAVSISMNSIVIAVIALVVLIVIVMIFTGTISDIAGKFREQTDTAGKKGDDAIGDIFSCEDSSLRCRGKDLYACNDGKWEIKQECKDGCENNACK